MLRYREASVVTNADVGRPYNCVRCGQTTYTPELSGRIPAYCPGCRPRSAKRGGGGGFDADTLVYRLALSVTAFQLGVDRARHALVQAADLDRQASAADLRRAVTAALEALDAADAQRLNQLTTADLLDEPPVAGAPDDEARTGSPGHSQ